jgi:transcriptional regulator with XRE-family HTH domain
VVDEITFGRSIRAIRVRKRLTQEQVAQRVGMSRGVVARIEQGHAARVTIETLERIAAALGARVLVKLLWQGEGLDRLLDGRHATVVEEVVRVLRATGWTVATEVSFNEFGERGSIDVFAFFPATSALLVVEVKTVIADAQDLQATLDRKVRLAPKLARDRGWAPLTVARVLVVVDTRSNQQRVDALAATFGATFPDRTWAARRWIATPSSTEPLRAIWFLRIGRQAIVTQRVRPARRLPTHGIAVRK